MRRSRSEHRKRLLCAAENVEGKSPDRFIGLIPLPLSLRISKTLITLAEEADAAVRSGY